MCLGGSDALLAISSTAEVDASADVMLDEVALDDAPVAAGGMVFVCGRKEVEGAVRVSVSLATRRESVSLRKKSRKVAADSDFGSRPFLHSRLRHVEGLSFVLSRTCSPTAHRPLQACSVDHDPGHLHRRLRSSRRGARTVVPGAGSALALALHRNARRARSRAGPARTHLHGGCAGACSRSR